MSEQKETKTARRTVKWGILGSGNIASDFATVLRTLPEVELVAVGASKLERAKKFAEKFGIPNSFGSYEELVKCEGIDVIYVATPHNFHHAHASLALNAGKNVLCEKALTVNYGQAEELVALARSKKLFLMEAMWTRFIPLMCKVREIISSGAIGSVRMAQADFGIKFEGDDTHRMRNPKLAGGSLLDLGIYSVSFCSMVYGGTMPTEIKATGELTSLGVDSDVAASLKFGPGQLALASCGMLSEQLNEAKVVGTKGWIKVHGPMFHCATAMTTCIEGKQEVHEYPLPEGSPPQSAFNFLNSANFKYQAEEVNRCVLGGKTESEIMPLEESLRLMKTMDTMREQIGVKYPFEK